MAIDANVFARYTPAPAPTEPLQLPDALIAAAQRRQAIDQEIAMRANVLRSEGLSQQAQQTYADTLSKGGSLDDALTAVARVSPGHALEIAKLRDEQGQEHRLEATQAETAQQNLAKAQRDRQQQFDTALYQAVDQAPSENKDAVFQQGLEEGKAAGIVDLPGGAASLKARAQRHFPAEEAKALFEKPAPVKTVSVQTTDDAGNPVTKLVPDTPGQTFPAPPKSEPKRTGEDAYLFSQYGAEPTAAQRIEGHRAYATSGRTPTTAASKSGTSDVAETIAGMKDGSLPPQLPGRATKDYTALMAEAHRQGYNLADAVTDWVATQKHIATLNGQQQTRLNQSINALPELLDSVEDLSKQWKGGSFPALNRVSLAAAKNGIYGKQAASIANQLDSQIADVNADLAGVYMGGNSPTDHGLELASKALKSDWDEKVMLDAIGRARSNVKIRQNSIRNTGVQGASESNPYAPKPASQPSVTHRFNPTTGKIEVMP